MSDLKSGIAKAFAGRTIPQIVLAAQPEPNFPNDDEKDALWFQSRDWRSVTWDDWRDHYSGLYFFTSEAFAYYLQSILILSLDPQPLGEMLAADTVLSLLSNGKENIESALRFQDLRQQELEVLDEWLSLQRNLPERADIWQQNTISDAIETVIALRLAAPN